MKKLILPGMAFLLMFLFQACSGAGDNPAVPDDPGISKGNDLLLSDGRTPIGEFTLSLGEDGEFRVLPMRETGMHFNVTDFLLPPGCLDCFWAVLGGHFNDIWQFDLHLKNPTGFYGYDVRGTIYDSGPIELLNPDSFTKVLAPPNDPDKLNPFLIFESNVGTNMWGPGGTGSAHAILKKTPGVGWAEISFLIDASWPGNQKEPVRIYELKAQPFSIKDDGSSTTILSCKVADWEMDVGSVSIDLTAIGGDMNAQFTWGDGKWLLPDVSHDPMGGNGPGVYDLLVTATSGGKQTYNYLRLTVEEGGVSEFPAEWTFFLYLHAANLPDEEDINEMEMAGSVTGKLNLIVLWDKPVGEGDDVILRVLHDSNPYDGSDQTLVSQEINDYGAVIPPSKQLDMGDGETLRKFLEWGMSKYHAKHYALDLWDHGGGIFQDGKKPPIFRNVCGGLYLWEIRDAIAAALATQSLVDKLDIIGFDVCILGEIETAYQLKDLVKFVVASEANEPGPGWEYGQPLISLKDNIDTQTAYQFAYNIVEGYRDSYDSDPAPYHYNADTTQAASSTAKLKTMTIPALNIFAQELILAVGSHKSAIKQCRDNSLNFWDSSFPDIGHFAKLITQKPALPQSLKDSANVFLAALEETMVHHAHTGTGYEEETGFRIWFPDDIDTNYYEYQYMDSEYLNFNETQWDEFLYMYANPTDPIQLDIGQVIVDDSTGGDGDGFLEANETATLSVEIENNGFMPVSNLNTWLQTEDAYINLLSDYSMCDSIPAGESRWVQLDYEVSVQSDCPDQHVYPFTVYITDTEENIYSPVFSLCSYPVNIVIVDLDGNHNSAPSIGAALDSLGMAYDLIQDPGQFPTIDDYSIMFVCLGMYSWDFPNHVLTDEEGTAIKAFLDAGGSVYIEGGDCWYFNPLNGAYDIGEPFGIHGTSDGIPGDIASLYGNNGTPLDGMYFTYNGEDGYPDHLQPDGITDSYTALTNNPPNYSAMIWYDSGTYKTIGCTFEFTGLVESGSPNTKEELMFEMITFLQG